MSYTHWCAAGVALFLICIFAGVLPAAEVPQPPCATPPFPVSAAAGEPAAVAVWRRGDLPDPWTPPACLPWQVRPFAVLIAVSGQIGGVQGYRQLLARMVRTSAIEKIRYWSFSRKRWRRLFSEVAALESPDPERRRPDFAVGEIGTGRDYYFWQKENSLASGMVFRNRALDISGNRLVLAQANVSASYLAFVKILGRGEFETVAFLEKEQRDVWRYYSLSRVGGGDDTITEEDLASVVNRLIAGFRYIAGVPTDREPPAMR